MAACVKNPDMKNCFELLCRLYDMKPSYRVLKENTDVLKTVTSLRNYRGSIEEETYEVIIWWPGGSDIKIKWVKGSIDCICSNNLLGIERKCDGRWENTFEGRCNLVQNACSICKSGSWNSAVSRMGRSLSGVIFTFQL